MKHTNICKSLVTHKICSSGNKLAVLNPKAKQSHLLYQREVCGCLHLCRCYLEELSGSCIEMGRASLEPWKKLWRVSGILLWLGWVPGKGTLSAKGGWVLLCAGCGRWRWHLPQELRVCSPDKEELSRSVGCWWGCLNAGEHQLWSHQELLGAPRLDQDCSCTSWLAGRDSVEPPNSAQSQAPCPIYIVCSPCPAGLHLGASCCLLWVTQKPWYRARCSAQKPFPDLWSFRRVPSSQNPFIFHQITCTYLPRWTTVCLWEEKKNRKNIKRNLKTVITLWKNLTEHKNEAQVL